jgi:hypothetical protein
MQPPPGAVPIDTDELLAAIGELYLQVRIQRKIIAQQQARPTAPADLEMVNHQVAMP